MEYRHCNTLTSGRLSAAAQRVMAALKAQYAGRIDRRLDTDSSSRVPMLFQDQVTINKPAETHRQNNIYHRESGVNLPEPDLVEENSSKTKPQLQEEKGRQLFRQSPETALPSQPDLRRLHDRDNKFNQWGADKLGDRRPRDYEDDGSQSGFNPGNNFPVPITNPPETRPQGEGLFPGKGFINGRKLQVVMGLPEAHGEINSRKGKIQLLVSSEENCEAQTIAHSPPVKRWRFGNLQIPVITCSKQFEEDDSEKPDKMQCGSLEKKTERAEEPEVDQNLGGEITEKFELNSGLFGGVVKESGCDNRSENEPNPSYLKKMSTSRRESANCLALASSCQDSPTNKIQTNGEYLPVQHIVVSSRTSDFNQYTEDKVSSALNKEQVSYSSELYMHQSDIIQNQIDKQECSTEPEHRPALEVTEIHHNQQGFLQVGHCGVECVQNVTAPAKQSGKCKPPQSSEWTPQITQSQEPFSNQASSISGDAKVQLLHQTQQRKVRRQFLYPLKSTPNQEEMPLQTASSLTGSNKQVEVISNIPKDAQQSRFASEVNEQIHKERDGDEDKTTEITKRSLALTSDPRVCDASCLSQEERMYVLEEAVGARALVVTMVYQDGTTQLDPEQKCPPAVCGLLVLLKKSLDSLVLQETGAAEERLLFLRLEQRPVWAQQDPDHNQELFTREILGKMVCGAQTLVCYKSKELLRTALRHFSKDLSWKQVAACQVLDPQIAAWLLDPAYSASCFQDLFNKYCTLATTHTPAQAELGRKKVNHVIASLSRLHRVMVELRNKLETQGLWQLYFCMEQKMIPVLAAMESHKIHVDRDALKKTSEMLGTKMKQLEQEAHQTAGQKFLVSSSSQLRQVLFEKLRLHERCENKKLPKTILKHQQSTSEAVLLQLQDLHPLPKIVLEYRQVHKIKSTFLDGILSCMTKTFISSTWNQTSTVSGRLSAKHPNFQALPRQPVQISKKQDVEGKEAELITVHPRTMFVPREGWTFLSADFCQVELRLLAHLSSDPELLRTFQNPEADIFNMLASQWKGISEDSVSAEEREHAKRIAYSVLYGAGKERLSGILGVSAEEASRFQDSFLQKYKEVQAFIQSTVQHCQQYGYVKSIMGRRRSLPHIHSTDWGIRNQAERQAVNFVVQGSAADLCKMAMIHISLLVASSTTLTARLVAQIHDELLFEVEDSQVEDFAALVKKTMESLQHVSCLGVSLTVPLKVSVSTGRSWGSMCEVSPLSAAGTHTSV